jgi:hypothetical protein
MASVQMRRCTGFFVVSPSAAGGAKSDPVVAGAATAAAASVEGVSFGSAAAFSFAALLMASSSRPASLAILRSWARSCL